MISEAIRQEVLDAALALRKFGLVWMAGGTVCARDPKSGHIAVTPSGLDYADLTPEDIPVVDIDMQVIEGKFRPSVATNLWTAMMKARPEINAVVHTHSPYATAFSVIDQPIPIITETQADWFGQPVRVARYAHIEDDHFLTAPVEALGDGYGVLLGQHGPITVGASLDDALERAVTLEEAAKTYFVAKVIGAPLIFTPEQAQASFEYYQNRYGQPKDQE